MKYKILPILVCCFFISFLLVNCTPRDPKVVIVTREVVETRITKMLVTQQQETDAELGYEDLPALDGIPTDRLINSRWQLERFVIDGVDSTNFVSGQRIQFEEFTWFGFDACNRIYGGYKANETGDFILNLGQTLIACFVIDSESGERSSMGDVEFDDALESVVAFQIRDKQLWLFYPVDRRHALVLSPQMVSEED